jgi:hypothetical protein
MYIQIKKEIDNFTLNKLYKVVNHPYNEEFKGVVDDTGYYNIVHQNFYNLKEKEAD